MVYFAALNPKNEQEYYIYEDNINPQNVVGIVKPIKDDIDTRKFSENIASLLNGSEPVHKMPQLSQPQYVATPQVGFEIRTRDNDAGVSTKAVTFTKVGKEVPGFEKMLVPAFFKALCDAMPAEGRRIHVGPKTPGL